MLFGFQHVDPLTGEFPPVTTAESGAIVMRMRRLLRGRSREDLDYLLSVVNFVLDSESLGRKLVFDELHFAAGVLDNPESITPEIQDRLHWQSDLMDEVGVFYACINRFDPSTLESHFPVQWHDLFAALALALLNEAADEEARYGTWPDDNGFDYEYRILLNVVTWTRPAERAATLAEALEMGWRQEMQRQSTTPPAAAENRANLSARNSRAALIRHARTSEAILKLTTYYRMGSHRSMRNAATRFCRDYPNLVAHLQPENRVRTLSEGLSRQLRGIERRLP